MSAGQVVGEPPNPGTTPPPDGPVVGLGDGAGAGPVVDPGGTVVSVVRGVVVRGVVVVGGGVVPGLGEGLAGVWVVGPAGCWVAGAGAPEPELATVGGRT